jgi:hypothetical protein
MLRRHVKRFAVIGALGLATLVARAAEATTTPTNVSNENYDYAATSESRDLVVRVDEALNALTYTYWRLGDDYFNASTGVYKVDCSGYANRMIEDSNPVAYDSAAEARDTTRLRADDWYDLFKSIPYGSTRHDWQRIEKVASLRPGDVVVYKYDEAGTTTGHTMLVVSRPVRDTRYSSPVYKVRVSDSAKSGHSSDNRGAEGSGVGAGYVLLKAGRDSGRVSGFAWSLKGYWKEGISLAMARPN